MNGETYMEVKNCSQKQLHEKVVSKANAKMIGAQKIDKLCRTYKALAEPSRVKLLLALLSGELCVYHLAEVTGSTQSAVSHQLRVLRDADIVRCRRDGKSVVYALADKHVCDMLKKSVQHLECEQ